MSATCVTPLRDRGPAAEARAAAALARPKAPPPLPTSGERAAKVTSGERAAANATSGERANATSMRVPKGSIAHNDQQDEQDDDWGHLAAVAKGRFADEEREWQEALARAKQVREVDEEAEWRRLREAAAARARVDEEREWLERVRAARVRTARPAPVRRPAPQLRLVAWP